MNRIFKLTFSLLSFLFSASNAQWLPQQIPSDVHLLLTIDFANANIGAAAGYRFFFSGRAIYTRDGGTSWVMANVPDSARALVTMNLLDEQIGFIAGAYNVPQGARASLHKQQRAVRAIGTERYLHSIGMTDTINYRGMFLKTTNGGQRWFVPAVLPDSIYYLIGASFVNERVGYVTGDGSPTIGNGIVLKTTNGGVNWQRLTIPDSIVQLRNIAFTDSLRGIAVGYEFNQGHISGVILRTGDGGLSWQHLRFSQVDNFTDICFADPSTCYAVGIHTSLTAAVYKSTNGGTSWSQLAFSPDTVLLEGVSFVKGTVTGMVFGEKSVGTTFEPFSARTTDGGTTWATQAIRNTSTNTLVIGGKLISQLNGYLSGGDALANGMVLHTTNGGVTSAGSSNNGFPNVFALHQNYPNPFNPSTVITYQLPNASRITLNVFDVLGQEVVMLVNEEKNAGTHVFNFDASKLSSGVYFYRLSAGSFSQTRKLVLSR